MAYTGFLLSIAVIGCYALVCSDQTNSVSNLNGIRYAKPPFCPKSM